MMGQEMQGGLDVDMSKTTAYICEECEHDVFNMRYKMRKRSSRKLFRRTARRVNKKNYARPMRGGYRL